jgi:hypothetical protein
VSTFPSGGHGTEHPPDEEIGMRRRWLRDVQVSIPAPGQCIEVGASDAALNASDAGDVS